MKIIYGLKIPLLKIKSSFCTIGVFDGVHLGHEEVIKAAVLKARQSRAKSVVITFLNHPASVISPGKVPPQLATLEQKLEFFKRLNVNIVILLKFTSSIASMPPEKFINILVDNICMKGIIVGHDYVFGQKKAGNAELLIKLGEKLGFSVLELKPLKINNIIVSSTVIRKLIQKGDIPAANKLFGRSYIISGKVVHGRKIGKTLGYPTANILPFNQLIPANGVYMVSVVLNRKKLSGLCNIGYNPTFNKDKRRISIEVYIKDFKGRIYGKKIRLFFLEKIRSERKFSSAEELKHQISIDLKQAFNL